MDAVLGHPTALRSVAAVPPPPRREAPLLAGAALLPLLTAGFVNLAAEWRVGPVSGMGAQTAVEAVLVSCAAFLAARWPRRLLLCLAPFALFLLWAALRSILAPPTFEGAQNALVYLLFGAGVLLSGTLATRDPTGMSARLARGIGWIQWTALAVLAANLALWGLPRGGNWVVGPRSLALVGLIPLNWHLARWSAGRRRSLWLAGLWFAAVVATTSRTASAIALVSLAVVVALQAPRRPGRAAAGLAALAAGLALGAALVAFAPPFHARFFQGDTSLQIGEYAINASGRTAFWRLMVESASEAPVVGHGLGSSQGVMAAEFFASDNIRHPHNDYLRLWHDLGAVGLGLLLWALLLWAVVLARQWRRLDRADHSARMVPLFALLVLLELLLAMTTDNVLVYPFFMGAAGIILGTALGLEARRGAPPRPDSR
ncbi:MAG TPA: O-antigen ligase family protein [Longimicrobium sp.]|nr:O-antigen ligase family protein [Longimicrobium sp.]